MNNSSNRSFTDAYRGIMTALFLGIANSFVSLIFNIFYRLHGPDFSNDLINVSYIIFGGLFLFFVIGLVYTGLHLISKRADLVFIIGFAVLIILIYGAIGSGHFATDPEENLRFRGMLHGLTIISGISAIAGIPFFYHNAAFRQYVV